jgi:hypothetical protein
VGVVGCGKFLPPRGFDPRTVQTVSGPGCSIRIYRKVEVQREEMKANLRKTTGVRNYTDRGYQRRITAASGLKGRGTS